jgi:hypothetical protein
LTVRGRFTCYAARFVTALTITSLTAASAAAPFAPAQQQAADEALRLFERGKEALRVGRFRNARADFERSLDLVKKPSAAFNLAVALRGMGLAMEAHGVLSLLLKGKYGHLPAERRSGVEELAREVSREIATLIVDVRRDPEAAVRIDGEHAGTAAPGRPLEAKLNPGTHVITLSARLHDTVERRVRVGSGRSVRLSEALEPSATAGDAKLVVSSENPRDTVEIVGVAAAKGRIERRLAPGRYEVRVRDEDDVRSSRITLLPGTEHRIMLDAPRPNLFQSPWFWVAAGTLAAGLAGGAYLLLRDRQREPVEDPEFKIVQTLQRF